MEKIKFAIGDKVSWNGIPVTVTDVWIEKESHYQNKNGIFYFVKSPWFDGGVKQEELR